MKSISLIFFLNWDKRLKDCSVWDASAMVRELSVNKCSACLSLNSRLLGFMDQVDESI